MQLVYCQREGKKATSPIGGTFSSRLISGRRWPETWTRPWASSRAPGRARCRARRRHCLQLTLEGIKSPIRGRCGRDNGDFLLLLPKK